MAKPSASNWSDSFETLYKLITPLLRQLVEILLAPFDGGQFGRAGNVEQCPVGLTTFKGNKKTSMFVRHVADNLVEESLTRLDQFVAGGGLPGHALEAALKLFRDILSRASASPLGARTSALWTAETSLGSLAASIAASVRICRLNAFWLVRIETYCRELSVERLEGPLRLFKVFLQLI